VKRGRSTNSPTKAEDARIKACKRAGCVPCALWIEHPDCPLRFRLAFQSYSSDDGETEVEYHHLLSGGIRRGHMFGIGCCQWHHRGVLDWGSTRSEMEAFYGPSLARTGKRFHEVFGSDEALLEKQAELLGEIA
jgi:hypothetical protein